MKQTQPVIPGKEASSTYRVSTWKQVLVCVVLSCCTVFSIAYLNCLGELSSGSLSDLGLTWRIGGVVSRITMPLCLLGFLYSWFLIIKKPLPIRGDVPVIVLSLLLSLLAVMGASFAQLKTITFFASSASRVTAFLFVWLSLASMMFPIFKTAFEGILDYCAKHGQGDDAGEDATFNVPHDYGRPWLFRLVPVLLLVSWLPYIILASPGSVSYDMTRMLLQFQGDMPYTTHHPLAATLVYGLFFSVGQWIGGSANSGVLAITIVQTTIWIAVCTIEIRIIRLFKTPFWLIACTILFFMAVPVFGTYCQYAVKDSLFGACFALYATLFVLYVKNPAAFNQSRYLVALFIAAAFATGIVRNNGFYVVLISLPFLALLHSGWKCKLKALAPLLVTIALIPLANAALQNTLGAASGSAAEALTIPFQQTARYALMHPDDIKEWEYDAIDAVLDYPSLAENYQWNVSDPVKSTFKGGSLANYFSAWASQGLRHPGTYLDATLAQSYGYWNPEMGSLSYTQEGYCFVTSSPNTPYWNDLTLESFGWSQWFEERAALVNDEIISPLRNIPLFSYLLSDGIYTWLLCIEFALLAYARKAGCKLRNALALLPCFVLLLTCIAGPLCGSVRYMLGIMAVCPLTICATLDFVKQSLNAKSS